MEVAVKKVVIVRVQHAFKVGKFRKKRWVAYSDGNSQSSTRFQSGEILYGKVAYSEWLPRLSLL